MQAGKSTGSDHMYCLVTAPTVSGLTVARCTQINNSVSYTDEHANWVVFKDMIGEQQSLANSAPLFKRNVYQINGSQEIGSDVESEQFYLYRVSNFFDQNRFTIKVTPNSGTPVVGLPFSQTGSLTKRIFDSTL